MLSMTVHHCEQFSTVVCSSGVQSGMLKVFSTTRVPAGRLKILSRSVVRLLGRRNSASAVAFEKSASYMSPCTNWARSATPSLAAIRFDSATMSGLYSTPRPRAPSLAAAITFRPSPDPRSTTKSCGVILPTSIILATVSSGDGTQTTSLPGCPTWGTNSSFVCAAAGCTHAAVTIIAARTRPTDFDISLPQAGLPPSGERPLPTRKADVHVGRYEPLTTNYQLPTNQEPLHILEKWD